VQQPLKILAWILIFLTNSKRIVIKQSSKGKWNKVLLLNSANDEAEIVVDHTFISLTKWLRRSHMNQKIETNPSINKYQVTVHFNIDDQFMTLVPSHRTYINYLINKGIIDTYTVTMETQRSWIIINAASKKEVEDYLDRSPLRPYWTYEIDELYVFDGQNYRLPALQLN